MRPVRVALIGVGAIGASHAATLMSSPLADLVVACDTDPNAGDRLPPGVPLVGSYSELFATPDLEAVFICTPQAAHRIPTELALERQLAVFCEKPIAPDLRDADAMIAAARETGGLLAIGHTLRFDPDYISVQQAVSTGELGTVISIACRRNIPDYEGRMIAQRTTLSNEVLIHDIDVVRWLAGDIERIYGESSSQGVIGPGLTEAVVATMRLASGGVATLESNWVMQSQTGPQSDFRLSVVGTLGMASIDYFQGPVAVFGNRPRFPLNGWLADVYGSSVGTLRTEVEHFLRCVRGECTWPISLSDARAALLGAIALDASIRLAKPVALSDIESLASGE